MFRNQVISNADPVPMSVAAETRLDQAVQAGTSRLLALQRPGDWWVGELESNVTITAQHLLFHEFMRVRTKEMTLGIVNELFAQQRTDGLWSIYPGGDPDLHATIESYAALRLAGFSPDDPKLEPARQFCLEQGGIGGTRVFTRMWLALFGVWSWEEIPQLFPEFIFLSPRLPVSLYTFACWARQTVGALTIVMHYRPVHRLPPARAIHELNLGPAAPAGLSDRMWGTGNRLAAWYLSHQRRPGSAKALGGMEQWILDRQELDGSWGGIQPPWVWSLIALALRGHGPESPALRRGLEGWNRFMVEDGDRLRPEACQSPVWDTALALLGLEASGSTIKTDQLRRAASWVVREEIRARGDWSIRAPGVEAAGWAFEYDNDNYPDIDDVAIVGLALDKLGVGRRAVDRACVWLKGMQSSNGGWGAFDIDNDAEWLYSLPFCDFGAVVDPPSADVTAHVVELLAPRPGFERPVKRGVDYLLREQEPDGSWFGRWGVNYIYGTGAVLPALQAAGFRPEHPVIQRAVRWVKQVQNDDGGFGEDCRSYNLGVEGRSWHGRGPSTPSQTAWALLALVAGGAARSSCARRGVDWLCENQRDDGDWDEENFTGTGFPRDFLIRYHLYRIVWPMWALGRYRQALGET